MEEAAIRQLSQYQCAHDLFEEFVCARFVPLQVGEVLFRVSNEKYKDYGIKCLDVDFRSR